MQHKPFRHIEELKGVCATFAEAYAVFLHSGNIPPSLEDDIHRLEQQENQTTENDDQDADAELRHTHDYDYIIMITIINAAFMKTVQLNILIMYIPFPLRNSWYQHVQPVLQKSGC